ncbi:hypothetical protein SAMN05216505_112230, partial [Streptomyces prasinopilosus]
PRQRVPGHPWDRAATAPVATPRKGGGR